MATIKETYTIPKELVIRLNQYSKNSLIPKSRLVSDLIKKFLDNVDTK